MKKNKKILIIGDSNCLPRYNMTNSNVIKLEETYIYKLKTKFKDYHFEQITLGGILTSELINHAIPYFVSWKPDILLMHTGINDTKSQVKKGIFLKIIEKIFLFLKFSKKDFKSKFLYNPSILKYSSESKTDLNSFEKNINKLKILFSDSKIFWLEIFSDERIDDERPNTKKNIDKFNFILKKNFKQNFIEIGEIKDKKFFTLDGYHLNKTGHNKLCEKLSKFIEKI
jgi:lysophospholipase L1-like esterase